VSEKYKTHSDGLYFVTFSVVGWLDVFTRRVYQEILIDSINFCKQNKELKIFCYCIMPSHVHFISYSENGSLSNTLRDLKAHTAKQLIKAIEENLQESKKELFLKLFKYFGSKSPQNQQMQFWKHDNHPFFLYSNQMIEQKINYIHNNPVEAGFVNNANEWRLSSANEECPIKIDVL
jgi:REP element-mobilizing transposase RayT